MNEENDRNLQRLFAAYAPEMSEQRFLVQTRTALIRQIQLDRARAVALRVLVAAIAVAVAVATAAPLNRCYAALEKSLTSLSFNLPTAASQALVYGATVAVLVLGRRRIRAFLGPW